LPKDGRLKDIAIEDVAHNSFAFLLNATSLEATVRVHGVSGREIAVRLLENGREVSRRSLSLVADQSHYGVSFEISPRRLGKHVYTVVAERLPDEVYLGNNAHEMVINVIRDKIRVLQIVGQPSWDERYLRDQLKEDPNIDLISFFILVNPLNLRPLNAAETALIPFPAQELFEEELGGFDLAIFQNFNYGPFRTRQYLPNIAQYIRDGGGFMMVGGPLSFASGGYYGTPITHVLPVDIPPGFGEEALLDDRPFRARLTHAGTHHPITRLDMDPSENARRWATTEQLEGMNLVTQTKPDAVTLLEHPTLRDQQGKKMPVVAVREVGEGRTMAVMTDSTWHWSFLAGNKGGDPRIHSAFWSNAIKWLIKDPAMGLVQVRALEERIPVGEVAKATIQVFQPDYRPAANQKIGVTIRRRLEGAGAGEGNLIKRIEDAKTDGDGVYVVEVPLEEAGIYEVEATASVVSGRMAKASDLWVATERNPELEQVVGDGRLLANLAEATGGTVQSLNSEEPKIELRDPKVTRILNRKHVDLWTSPWVLMGLIGVFGTEWWLRRRFGFL
ncbi:MAG: glutamine amidotransferase, partial [Myxococcota bacterium]|nr:glutamine amidotransferase [Myxococcota bacterium]